MNALAHLVGLSEVAEDFLCLLLHAAGTLLADAGLLAGEVAEIVELGTTYLTNLVHFDALDSGRLDGEDTLNTYGAGHLADGETLLLAVTGNLDDYATVELDALLRTFDNLVSYGNGVASLEGGVLLASGKCCLGNFNKISHFTEIEIKKVVARQNIVGFYCGSALHRALSCTGRRSEAASREAWLRLRVRAAGATPREVVRKIRRKFTFYFPSARNNVEFF